MYLALEAYRSAWLDGTMAGISLTVWRWSGTVDTRGAGSAVVVMFAIDRRTRALIRSNNVRYLTLWRNLDLSRFLRCFMVLSARFRCHLKGIQRTLSASLCSQTHNGPDETELCSPKSFTW